MLINIKLWVNKGQRKGDPFIENVSFAIKNLDSDI